MRSNVRRSNIHTANRCPVCVPGVAGVGAVAVSRRMVRGRLGGPVDCGPRLSVRATEKLHCFTYRSSLRLP